MFAMIFRTGRHRRRGRARFSRENAKSRRGLATPLQRDLFAGNRETRLPLSGVCDKDDFFYRLDAITQSGRFFKFQIAGMRQHFLFEASDFLFALSGSQLAVGTFPLARLCGSPPPWAPSITSAIFLRMVRGTIPRALL